MNFITVGSGYWGINYVRVLSQLPEVDQVVVCDQSEQRLQEIQKNFPKIKTFRKIDDALAFNHYDAGVVCTNPDNHFDIARKILEAGAHILVEKPITTKSEEAKVLDNLAKKLDKILMVGHIFLFNSGVEKLKDEVVNGNIGKIHYLYSSRTNLGPIRNDVNAIWDLAPHDISIFNYLLDSSPDWVSVVGSAFLVPNKVDVGFLAVHYPNNIIGNIHVSWADPNKVRETVVVGSEQRMVFNDLSAQKVTIYKKGIAASSMPFLSYGDYQFALRDGDILSPCLAPSEPLKKQVLHFIDCIINHKIPLTDGTSGINVVKVLEAADASIKLNGAPIKINYENGALL
jgi:predicted dehydrogenase